MPSEKIALLDGDITSLAVDAIVNAANSSLMGGGGVDGAIHRAAGPELKAECRTLDGCPAGEARITRGHNLAAVHVIHTVGPVWRGGDKGEAEQLARCYHQCFKLAEEYGLRTLAFPAISTGVYGFPRKEAARIAVREARKALAANPVLEKIFFVCFEPASRDAYEKALAE